MHIHKAELITSAVKVEQYPDLNLPEIVLAGRSNVGKSTFINTMLNRKKLAFTSSKPGKTQLINFFNVNDELIFVDVPGYGYAAVSKKQQIEFGKMFELYIENSKNIKLAILLIDLRHKPTEDDLSMLEYFRYFGFKILIVGTKMDKLKNSERVSMIRKRKKELNIQKEKFIPYTALNKENSKEIWEVIFSMINKKNE